MVSAHLAVEQQDLPRLKTSSAPGTTSRTTTATGGPCSAMPSMPSTTAMSRPADRCTPTSPRSSSPAAPTRCALNGMTVIAEAEIRGHWLAAEIDAPGSGEATSQQDRPE